MPERCSQTYDIRWPCETAISWAAAKETRRLLQVWFFLLRLGKVFGKAIYSSWQLAHINIWKLYSGEEKPEMRFWDRISDFNGTYIDDRTSPKIPKWPAMDVTSPGPEVVISNVQGQVIEGFGGAFTESSAAVYKTAGAGRRCGWGAQGSSL